METETSLPHSQQPVTFSYPETEQSSTGSWYPKSQVHFQFLVSELTVNLFKNREFDINPFRKTRDYNGGDVNCSALSIVHPFCIRFFLSLSLSFFPDTHTVWYIPTPLNFTQSYHT